MRQCRSVTVRIRFFIISIMFTVYLKKRYTNDMIDNKRIKKNAAKAAFLRGEFMKKFYLLSNEVMSGGTSFDEFSISRNCVHLVS